MGSLPLQILREVDDVDGLKRALLHADTATDAELLRKSSSFRFGAHLDTELAHPHHRTRLLTLLLALLWFAFVIRHDGDARKLLTTS